MMLKHLFTKLINKLIVIIRNLKTILKYKKTDKRIFFLIGTPNHGNGGDIAIALVEHIIIGQNFPNTVIYDIDTQEYFIHYLAIKRISKNNDVFILIGGGNFGNQYMREEKTRRHVIQKFPNNQIVMFPQSIFFTNDNVGLKERNITQNIYNSHNNIVLSARDKISYQMMTEWFPQNKCLLIPDIVLYLEANSNYLREGALMCMRKDLECIISEEECSVIKKKLESVFNKVSYTDTWVNYKNIKAQRKSLIENKLKEFQQSKIVITDRIHGMIFAAITGTPCIALSNYNHKVKGAYEMIKKLDYIKYANNIEEAIKLIDIILPETQKKHIYQNQTFMPLYNQLLETIL